MATVIRPPVITNNRPKIDGTHLRQFVSAGLALLTAVALPVGQARHTNVGFDIPNPKLKIDSPIARDRQRINDLPRQLAQTLPFRTTDWRIPLAPKPSAPDTPYLNVANIRTVVAATKPFLLSDWALPQKFRPDPPDATWSESLALSVANQSPILDVLFSRPGQPTLPTPRESFVNLVPLYTVVVTTAPFYQTDWPLPKKGLLDLPDASWASSLTLVAPKPFLQSDWFVPQKFRPDPPDVTYSESLALSFGGQPFALRDWPLAVRARATPDSQVQNIAALRTVVVSTTPFSQLDWPLAKKIRTTPPVWTSSESLSLTAKPFLQLGWDLPRRIDSPLARDRQRQNDLARQTFVKLPAQPYDWPAPKGRRLPTPDTIYGTVQSFRGIVSAAITLAATEAQDIGAFDLSFWRVEPFTAGGWIREFIPGVGPVLQFVNNTGDLIKFVNNNGDEIIFTANQVSIWNAEAATPSTWAAVVIETGPILTEVSIEITTEAGVDLFTETDAVWSPERPGANTWRKG